MLQICGKIFSNLKTLNVKWTYNGPSKEGGILGSMVHEKTKTKNQSKLAYVLWTSLPNITKRSSHRRKKNP